MSSVAVLGGGVSGLAAAYYLARAAQRAEGSRFKKVVLFEVTGRLGGWVGSERGEDSSVWERGPRSVRGAGAAGHNTLELVEELGLEGRVLPIQRGHPAASDRYIYANGRLNALPNSVMGALTPRPPFSRPLAFHVLAEPCRARCVTADESVDSFFRRRLGNEVAQYAADPLCRGVFAGDSRALGVRACFPALHALEQQYGSLVWGTVRKPRADNTPPRSALVRRMKAERWSIWSLIGGLGELPTALRLALDQRPGVELCLNTACERITFNNNRAEIETLDGQGGRGVLEVDHVISALPSHTVSGMLKDADTRLSSLLRSIEFVSVAVVSLQYNSSVIPVQGFGHLVPSHVSPSVLGVLYDSNVFPQHSGSQHRTKLTVMLGGAWFEEAYGPAPRCDEDLIGRVAVDVVGAQLGVREAPVQVRVNVLRDCIAQYRVGHCDTLDRVSDRIQCAALPLSLIGASYRGVSVNDCIYNARLAVDRLLQLTPNTPH